ncbi:amino acid/amide ABC transporter membrane protein 2, HAAT family [Desulfomonile tiedjei DSM 6799]|uniref:Amino acid/amide ABC transporter membrane protein 2, HAAT family n=1 Tax=Desulfomonile tiedjei (strain ATCC 49306 / DSM 6799 / DCB-1) TaxID=706587 RepID=I4C0S9_DESTA|nr:amino acid/amide ABC transporter membrane protein 2, HAAT family [Desulfomonile tiedjei DSM 6799]
MVNSLQRKAFTRKDAAWLVFLAILALLPLFPVVTANSFRMHVMILILLFASMAQAWNIIGGYCGQVSFGHSVFFGIGAYGAGMAVVTYGGLPWPGILIGMIVAAIVAVIISYPCFKLSGHYFAIATFAIVEIFNRAFLVWDWIGGALGLDYPLVDEGLKNLMWHNSKIGYYYCALVIFILIFGVVRWLESNRFGYYMRAVREGQETAESLGVNSTAVKLAAMALSAAMAAICGAFFVQYNLRVDPPMVMSLDMSMKFVLITILGGSGTLIGPLLGAAVLIPMQEYTRAFWGGLGGGVDLIVFGLLIILMVIKQPAGMIGIVRDMRSWFSKKTDAAKGDGPYDTP